ncbi:protoporphyrinogen oxidase [Paenibacillus sp. FJAT-26967]|uniref:protoporphyrinogen oxidase n=1 Tax=Paenibacillus sp. FJAT-26967 TaxID=1729690 RepID=UPI000837DF94|nr:protoporphyrinogen oxidase [Paenibacillus sp. FJAT-26967]
MSQARKVIVIGGGITGMTAAYYLKKRLDAGGFKADITLVEGAESLGGRINTLRKDGFVIEKGPDSFLARKLPIIELSKELGLEDELTGTNPEAKKTYILRDGKLHPMPPGLVLGIPTELGPFMRTALVSPAGKARALLDLILPKKEEPGDESLGHFLERRLGKEVLEQVVEPLLAGIYAGDTFALSLQSTFPQFGELEQEHRSLIYGMMNNRKQTQLEARNLPVPGRKSTFLTYKNGLSTLVQRLEEVLRDSGVNIRTGVKVTGLQKQGGRYRVALGNGQTEEADSVIVTLPTYHTAELLGELAGVEKLKAINYVSVANVVLAYRQEDANVSFDGSGFLIPRLEGRSITACTWTSTKWLHTAPEGHVLLRCYVGRSGAEDWVELSDGELVAKVRQDVAELMGIEAEPLFHEVTRLHRSMPQYPVGHLDNIRELRSELAEQMPGVYVTGAGFHGVGLPDCIRQGRDTAYEAAERLMASTAVDGIDGVAASAAPGRQA